MNELVKLWKPGLTLTRQLLRQQWIPLLGLWAVTSAVNIFSEEYLATLDKNADSTRLILQASVGLWGMIEGILLLLVLSWGIPLVRDLNKPSLEAKPFATDYVGSFLAEYFRGLAQVLLWSLAVLIPGFVRYVRLLFLPYVVLFAKPYREGKVDAIRLSYDLTVGRFKTLLLVTLIPAAIEIFLVFLPQMSESLHVWPVRLCIDALGYGISVWSFAILFLLFESALESHEWSAA